MINWQPIENAEPFKSDGNIRFLLFGRRISESHSRAAIGKWAASAWMVNHHLFYPTHFVILTDPAPGSVRKGCECYGGEVEP